MGYARMNQAVDFWYQQAEEIAPIQRVENARKSVPLDQLPE